jgi:hypothetical protein
LTPLRRAIIAVSHPKAATLIALRTTVASIIVTDRLTIGGHPIPNP